MSPLVEEAARVSDRDHAGWKAYSFRRYVKRQRLNRAWQPTWSTEYLFDVRPTDNGFDEELIEIDGRLPSPEEVLEHRMAGRFEKYYESGGSLRNPFGKDLPLLPLLFGQKHVYAGRGIIQGAPCLKTEFSDRIPPSKESARRRLEYVFKGEACFSVYGHHLVFADMETARPVSAGIVKLQYLRMRIEMESVRDDLWLPTRIEFQADIRLGIRRLRKANLYRYSNYHLVAD